MKSFVLLDFLGKRLKASSKSSLIGPFFSSEKINLFQYSERIFSKTADFETYTQKPAQHALSLSLRK